MKKTAKEVKLNKPQVEFVMAEVSLIEDTLNQMSAKEGHGLGYEINFNLNSCRKVIKDWNKRIDAFKDDYYEKDLNGKNLVFVSSESGELIEEDGKILVTSPNVKSVPKKYKVSTGLKDGQITAQRFNVDKLEEIQEGLNKFRDEVITLNFKMFKENTLNEAFKRKRIDGIDLTPLFGVLIF